MLRTQYNSSPNINGWAHEIIYCINLLQAEDMIDRVRESFEENLKSVKWMDKETQRKAIEKAVSISEMIGMFSFSF